MKQEIEHDIATTSATYGLSDEQQQVLVQALNDENRVEVRRLVRDMHAADIADFIGLIQGAKRTLFIEYIRKNFDPEIFLDSDYDTKEAIIEQLGIEESAEAIATLDSDDAVDVIEDLNEGDQQDILEAIEDKQQRAELEEGLSYPEDSAGRLLEKQFVSVPEFYNVGQTIDHLRQLDDGPSDFYEIFLVDPAMKPIGGVMLSRVMRSHRDIKMRDLMRDNIKVINATMDQEEVAFIFRQYGLASAPVINDEGRMIGVISVDDVVDVMAEEAHEDIMHLGGISESDLHTGFFKTAKRRFPWLVVNLITAIIASIVIAMFENNIAALASLAVLMPIIASMGGNAGTQTLTVAVRAIATKELTAANGMYIVGKELLVGMANGLAFAVITGLMVYGWYADIWLSIVFAIATILTMLLAGFAGVAIPLGLVRLGVDPAIASSVFLTTITDVVAFASFLGFAAAVLL